MRIGGNTGQMADMGESVMRIGGNTGQMADMGKSVTRIGITLVKRLIWVSRS